MQTRVKIPKDVINDLATRAHTDVPGSTPLSLLEGVKSRDPEAWRRLVYLYGPLVFRWCRQARVHIGDIEDIAQEVFLTVALKIGRFRRQTAQDTFRGWLWTITHHKVGDWLRRCQRDSETCLLTSWKEIADKTAPVSSDSAEERNSQEIGGLYRRALDLIRPEFEDASWQAFWRVALEGQRPADVADDLNMSRNAVYVAKSRILRRLRQVLGESE